MADWPKIEYAQLEWRDDQPFNPQYGDHYFARESGYDESRYIFLQQNDLPNRWRDCENFVIAETGFGSGLNFLVTVDEWLTKTKTSTLYYYSIEQHPFRCDDMRRVIDLWPHLGRYVDELCSQYPKPIAGFHRIEMAGGRVVLVLMIGDALAMLRQLHAKIDAWFLDGFAPAKNPDMWNPRLFEEVARHSKQNSTFATFTAAGFVRRGLQDVGFFVDKFTGFGNKREMLRGQYQGEAEKNSDSPWFDYSVHKTNSKTVAVIGGGIAGAATAYAFAKRGWSVTIVEQNKQLASKASGNPFGIVMPRITFDWSGEARYGIQAFLTSVQWLESLNINSWNKTGVLQLLSNDEVDRWQSHPLAGRLFELLNSGAGSQLAKISLSQYAMFFADGGYVSPRDVCEKAIEQAPNAKCLFGKIINRLVRDNDQWILLDASEKEIERAAAVVIASGADDSHFEQLDGLVTQAVRGQISYVQTNEKLSALAMPVCGEGYIIPQFEGLHCVGATFENSRDESVREGDHDINFGYLRQVDSESSISRTSIRQGRAALRTTTRDHLPMAGLVPIKTFYQNSYSELHHGRAASQYPRAEYYPGLYVNIAHGARGLSTAYPNALLLSELADGLPSSFPKEISESLHPARFWVRDMKRNRFKA